MASRGGSSAPSGLNELDPGLGSLGDVAFDPNSNQLWVVDGNSPATINRVDMSNGHVLQTITLPSASFGSTYYYYAGLQVAPSALPLNGTTVAAGSLLLFNGFTTPDRVTAIDPTTGAVIATLTLGQNYDLTGGVFDPTSGHLLLIDRRTSPGRVLEINPTNGAELSNFTLPFTAGQTGLAINPLTGNIWYGSDSSNNVVELSRTGTVLRTVNLALQGIDNFEISGLAFDAQGKLFVSSSQGVVYSVTV